MTNQLSVLNHLVGARVSLRDVDLDCLDLLDRNGPTSPSALARLAGVHPATMTGILDRLQRGGWISRDRDPEAADRRSVVVRIRAERGAEIYRHYAGMLTALDRICATYSEQELELVLDFLDRVTTAGREAGEELAAGE
jgi:DNA-binding MarR family transcriptional regulator